MRTDGGVRGSTFSEPKLACYKGLCAHEAWPYDTLSNSRHRGNCHSNLWGHCNGLFKTKTVLQIHGLLLSHGLIFGG